ncbi:helix-turn-helix domain-containing protein [Vannielia litorea]|uniref:helix-turn-helix domain-containing protein n=1 Tax=Vannielia litorea TaxID=1217970 RepID=UPI001C98BD5A|nr:helix-turn-helix domain-containing protein [Vannielia litorea]MBY6153392.1 helix-turn-helix domain-containing protein [Vannielia litorea]
MGPMTKADARDRLKEAPLQIQAGNVPVLAEPNIVDSFLTALAKHEGNLSKACNDVGLSRSTVYRYMASENVFREKIGVVQALAIQGRAHELLDGVNDHLRAHLRDGWEYVTDEDGNPVYERDAKGNLVLDDDLEAIPMRRSVVSIKSLEGLHRELRHTAQGEPGTAVAIQNINQAEARATVQASRSRPRLVREPVSSAVVEDAEIIAKDTESHQE